MKKSLLALIGEKSFLSLETGVFNKYFKNVKVVRCVNDAIPELNKKYDHIFMTPHHFPLIWGPSEEFLTEDIRKAYNHDPIHFGEYLLKKYIKSEASINKDTLITAAVDCSVLNMSREYEFRKMGIAHIVYAPDFIDEYTKAFR